MPLRTWSAIRFFLALSVFWPVAVSAQVSSSRSEPSELSIREAQYYEMSSIPIPEGIALEVGGSTMLEDGRLALTTRRGDVWLVESPSSAQPSFTRFAQGLHEPLGIAQMGDALYVAQRPELTRLRDTNGDDRADRYETVYRFPISGNYHEYAFGPEVTPEGNMRVTLNLAWVGYMGSPVPWRGWMLEITPEGEMTPIATGMRSPAGIGYDAEGEVFYTENQGGWIGSGRITHVEKGDFVGHPSGLKWSSRPGSPLALTPEDIPDSGRPMHEVADEIPGVKPPAVWLPHGVMGISTSDILVDSMGGAFGPFEDQLFIGDQGHSKITRVSLEKVKGVYQGAAFPFREGFASGVLRMNWGREGTMYVGQTSRGWTSLGSQPYALQRLQWTGKMPFEVEQVSARADGFELTFTQPVSQQSASQIGNYDVTSFTYKYHSTYGSPVIENRDEPLRGLSVSDDGRTVRVALGDDMRRGYIHEIKLSGLESTSGQSLLHDTAYYTLNRIPDGDLLAQADMTTEAAGEPAASAETAQESPSDGGAAGGEPAGNGATQPEASQDEDAGRQTSELPKHQTERPASWASGADTTITIGTRPGLRYDLEQFQVPAGSRVKLVFNNGDDMLHNLAIVQPGAWKTVAQMAIDMGIEGSQNDYIPDTDKVLFHTSMLDPGAAEPIYFTAPTVPDDYTYVCTFPGHAPTMQGVMRVTASPAETASN